ncbi:hypothetical protein BaRGS_00006901, partial [Batillaria attramentaria]
PISSLWDNDGTQCATKCTDSRKFKYTPGSVYQFEYTAETATSMEHASEDTARLAITATAHVHVISSCDMVLQLRDIQVQESNPNGQGMRTAPNSAMAAARLEMKPLRFSFQDGVVAELCPDGDEDTWALNVKRGFLSAFQNGMARLDDDSTVMELDVAGRCPSEYHVVEKGWYSTTVKRSKDLLACTDRHDYQTALSASPYQAKSSVQSMPLMKSSHECEQVVDQYGILTSATCNERHLFRPFSREASGALTKVTQTLKFKGKTTGRINVPAITNRVSMMYDHGSREEQSREARMEAEHMLRQLCRDTQDDIRPDTPRLFANLVSVMRKVDASGLKSLYSQLEQNTLCANNIRTKKFFVDALPMVGTEATVSMMTQMLNSGDVTGMEAEMWMTSLALLQNPTANMLANVKNLLKNKKLADKATMPISTMVHHYCRDNADCSDDMAVKDIMNSFESLIGSSCYANKKNLDDVLLGLRAIGNAGHVSSAVGVVNKCIKRSRNDVEVRVAAAEAFRRMPCDANRDDAMDTFADTNEDSEVRIAAYLAVMTCPTMDSLDRVKRVLEAETDQQVGSFVWSHLTNLQETSSPHKQAVRQMLEDVTLPEKFDLGRLQFSRNYEGSLFLKRFNTGAGAEANLVWSSASSLPRSAAANLTVDLFGKSLNLLQVGGRLEGLEYLVETLLGPYGYFGDSNQEDLKKSRAKLDELKGSMYLRMFGNEMTYQRFQGMDTLTSGKTFNMLDFLIKLSKDHDISLTQSMVLMDTSMTIPTSSGLPLTLTVNGTATVDLQASGKMDLRKVSAKPRSLQIDGEIRPSGAVRVEGTMSVDAMVTRSALRVTGTLHSSTAIKGRVDLDRGRVLSVELDVPQDKMEIFDIRSEFAIVHNTVEKEQKMITDNRQTIKLCTGDMAARVVGLELCGELQYPNASTTENGPYFPFTGPTSLTIALYKKDTHSRYKLLAKRVENKKTTMAQLSFNTPGSKVDRSMAFDLVIDHDGKQLEVNVASPWKKAEFKAGITHTKQLIGVSGSVVTDDVNTYAVTSEVKMSESKNGVTYTPRLEIRRPDTDNVALTGFISIEDRKSASVELALAGVTQHPLTFKTAMTNTNKEMSLTGAVANGDKNEYSARIGTQMNIVNTKAATKVQLNPFLSVKTPSAELISVTGSGNYNQGKVIKGDLQVAVFKVKPASIQFSAVTAERKSSVRYTTSLNMKSSLVTTKMSTVVNVKKGRLINGRSTITYNVPRVARDKLVLTAKLSDRSTKAYNKYTVRTSMDSKSFPDYNTAVKLNVDHKKKLTAGELEVRYGDNPKDKTKRVFVSGTLARKVKNLKNMDLNYKLEAQAPSQSIDMRLKGKHSHTPTSLDSNVALTYAKGKDASMSLTLRDKSDKLKKMNGVLTLQAPGTGLTLKSDLAQQSQNQWEHNVQVKTGGGSKHSLSTVYRMPGADSHDIVSTLSLDGMKPLTVSGQANLDMDDLQLGSFVKYGKDTYGISGSHKMAKSRGGKWGLEVQIPSRRMTLGAEAGHSKGGYEGSVEAAWDADKDKNAKIALDGLVNSKSSKSGSSHNARVRLFTPFDKLENIVVSVGLDSSNTQHEISTKMVFGGKKDVLTSSLVVSTPFTPQRAQITWKAETPFRGYGSMEVSLDHSFGGALNTKFTTALGKDKCEASLTAENRGTSSSRDLQGALTVKSTWRTIRDMTITAAHKDDGRNFANNVNVNLNDQKYAYVMSMDHSDNTNKGEMTVSWPRDQLKAVWDHRMSANVISSSTSCTWGRDKRVQFDVTGRHLLGNMRTVTGNMALQTPWTRDWSAEVKHEHGMGKVISTSSLKEGQREAFSHNLAFNADSSKTGMEFKMTSPWTEPISSKLNARYDSFPMSANAEFSWEPSSKVTADGSVIVNNWDDLDISVRVTTPVRGMRSLAAQITSKSEGSEVVSHATFDYGVRDSFDLETRVQRDLTSARAKVKTSFEAVRVIEGGILVQPDLEDFSLRADFKATPVLGKYESALTWTTGDDFNARFRLDTPHTEFPYLQLVVSSQDKRRVRQSHVELEYSPRQIYSLDTTYSFEAPLLVDITARTPIAGYDSLGATFKHFATDYSIKTSAEVTYASESTVKTGVTVDWSRGLDSSLTVSTPFAGWEQSSAAVRHEGEINDFNCYADVSVAGSSVTGTLKFVNKAKTDAQLSLSTPWSGYEKIEASVSRKGDMDNMRGMAILKVGEQKMQANLNHKWNARRLRTVASVNTPYTEEMNLKLEHTGDLSHFQTEGDLSYGRAYALDGSVSFNMDQQDAAGSTTIKYRLGGPKTELAAAFGKTGPMEDLAVTASARMDKDEISATAALNTRSDVRASITLRTPFRDFESMSASLDTTGMSGEASVEYMTGKVISGKLEMNGQGLEQMSLRGSLTSPISGMERTTLSVSHAYGPKHCNGAFDLETTIGNYGGLSASYMRTGKMDDMKAEAKITRNGESGLEVFLMHEMAERRLHSSLRVLTAYTEDFNMELRHNGDLSDFTTTYVTSLGGNKVTSETSYSYKYENIDLTHKMSSMFMGESNKAGIIISKVGSMDDVTVMISGNVNSQKGKVTGKFAMGNDMSGSLEVNTPFERYRQVGTSFKYAGDMTDMTLTAACNVQGEKIEATVKFANAGAISGSIDIATPISGFRHMGTAFNYNGDLHDLSAMLTGNLEDERIEAIAKFTNARDMAGSLTIHTPFYGYTQMGSSFTFNGDLSDMSLVMGANLMQDKVEATTTFTNSNGISGSVDVTTPFQGFRKVGANFKHSGNVENFKSEGLITYMDGQEISAQLNFFNYLMRRIEVSAELKTPFQQWEMTRMSYKHAGSPDKFECNAELECSQGQKSTMNLKVNVRGDQMVELTVDTPYDGYRHTQLTHSLSLDNNVQWTGSVEYGDRQRAAGQMTFAMQDGQISFNLEGRSPFTSDLIVSYERQPQLPEGSYTEKKMLKYGDDYMYTCDSSFTYAENLMNYREQTNIVWSGEPSTRSFSIKREGPWSDVRLEVKGEMDGQEVTAETTFKNEYGRIESAVKVNTPFDGFTDIGVSFQHYGQLAGAFNTEVKVEYMDDTEITAKVDFMRAGWQRLEMTSQLTTPFEGWTQSSAEFRYSTDNDGLTGYAGVEHAGEQRMSGDLRLTTSPNPEMTFTIKTPFTSFEQMSATAGYQADGWGKQETSAKLDLGHGLVYTITTGMNSAEDAPRSLTARLTTPHGDWHTVETRLGYQGGLQDFKTTAFLSTPLTDDMSASGSFRYVTPFDMNAAATFESSFDNFRDLKMEVMNTERDSQKTSHMLVSWAQGQEVVIDGTWRHQAGWYDNRFHTDLTISSPFEVLRSGSWLYESHTTQTKREDRVEMSMNGEKCMDTDMTYIMGDLPELTLNVRKPRPMLYTATRTADGAQIFVDWDRNDPSSNLRLTSRFTDSSDDSQTQHDLDVKLIHPTRTMGVKYSLLSNSGSTSSQGELSWDEGDNQRLTYNLDFTDRSRRSATSYEGKVKVGAMQRALELTGAWTDTRVAREMDAAFSWDADRDQTKQVGVKTRWTSGAKNKGDITVSLPAIGQELRVESEVAMNEGKTLLDATTALSYSPDARKTLTLSSKLEDTTSAWTSGSNYSLSLSLTHPYTDLDISMTSHIGNTGDRYSAAVDTWYLTSRREKKNMALRGEIDRLRRQLSMEMVSPTNYDLEHPEHILMMKAMYVNDSAVRAEVSRNLVTGTVTDAMMTARLNTSTLLHSRLHWRPASLAELQQYAVYKLAAYGERSKQTMTEVTDAIGEEIGQRYARTASALADDLTPLINLVDGELTAIGQELTRLRRQLNRAYRRNDFYMQDMGDNVAEYYNVVQEYLGEVSYSYQEAIRELSAQMAQSMERMKQFPVREQYQAAVNDIRKAFEEMVDSGVMQLSQAVAEIDNYLLAARQHSQDMRDSISGVFQNMTVVQRIKQYGDSIDFTPYIDNVTKNIRAIRIPEQYTAPMYAASERMRGVFQQVLEREEMQRVGAAANEVYQQVEENMKKHLHSIVNLIKEIIADEMEVYTAHFRFLKDSHVTVWDPEHGEVQVEVSLPVPMETLDSLPDVTPIIREYNNAVNTYVPDRETIQDLYNNYGPQTWWPENNTTPVKEVLTELESFDAKYKPKYTNRKYLNRRRAVVAI